MEYMCFNMYENTYISAQNQSIVHLWSHTATLQTIFSMQQLFHRLEAPTVTQSPMQSGTVASLRKSDTKV